MSTLREDERRTYCRICPAQCGLIVTIDGERIVSARGDVDHPLTGGYTCPKGRAAPAFHHHPDRLDHPRLRPPGGPATNVSWEALLDDLAGRLLEITQASGAGAVACYQGTWSWFDVLGRRASERLMRALGSPSVYSALTVDGVARSYVAELMGGHGSLLPNLDVDETGLLLLVGTNPIVSHGHASALPDPVTRLRRVADRAGLWVMDPLRTETARLATRHLPVRPGTDHVVLAHLVRELLAGGADREYLDEHASGVDLLVAAVAPFTDSVAARASGVSESDIADLVRAVRASRRVTVLTGTGTTMGPNANLTEWMAWAVQVVTGSFEQPGGAWFNPGYLMGLDRRRLRIGDGTPGEGPASRPDLVGRFGEYPCAGLADEIEAGNIRALFVFGGSPLTALPDTDRLRAAISRLDVLAVADVVATDTVALATHVLPVTGQFERSDVTYYVELFLSAVAAQYTPAVVAPGGDRRPLWWALGSLGRRLGLDILDGGLDPATCRAEDLLDVLVAPSSSDTAGLFAGPQTRVADPRRPRGWVHRHVLPEGRWRVATVALVEQLAAAPATPPDGLVMTPRRVIRRMNSVIGDVVASAAKVEDRAVLLNAHDAQVAGIADGEWVRVQSRSGQLVAPARVRPDVVAGTVSVPHGLPAQNVSRLTTSGPGEVDRLTGMVVQSGLPVTIEKAEPQA